MHIEILVEDSSGKRLLDHIVPTILGAFAETVGWRVISYRGIGKIPANLKSGADAANRILLDQLPRVLKGYGKTPGYDAVVVVMDSDRRDCAELLAELHAMLAGCQPTPLTLFRLAIEEVEAWLLGDRVAVLAAYPKAKVAILEAYQQDSVCGTWEVLADALHKGGSAAVKRAGWPLPGQLKHEWAEAIGPLLNVETNQSPSFGKFRDGLRRLAASAVAP